jgi:hypothetical protein
LDRRRNGELVDVHGDRSAGRHGIGLGVRTGIPKSDISSVDAFKRTLLKAMSVAYFKEGTAGLHFLSVLNRLGITTDMTSKLKAYDTTGVGRRHGIRRACGRCLSCKQTQTSARDALGLVNQYADQAGGERTLSSGRARLHHAICSQLRVRESLTRGTSLCTKAERDNHTERPNTEHAGAAFH